MEFPALVYRSASVHLLVQDEAEHAAALADGWFATVPEALAPKPEAPRAQPFAEMHATSITDPLGATTTGVGATALDERETLETRAHELGVAFSARIGNTKLAERIADAEKAKA
jgi:hypothetical protein